MFLITTTVSFRTVSLAGAGSPLYSLTHSYIQEILPSDVAEIYFSDSITAHKAWDQTRKNCSFRKCDDANTAREITIFQAPIRGRLKEHCLQMGTVQKVCTSAGGAHRPSISLSTYMDPTLLVTVKARIDKAHVFFAEQVSTRRHHTVSGRSPCPNTWRHCSMLVPRLPCPRVNSLRRRQFHASRLL